METITVYQGSVAQQACQAILAANSNNAMYHTKYDQPVEGINIKSAGFWEEDGKWIAYVIIKSGKAPLQAICDYFQGIKGIPDYSKGSACKRLCMFMRWMVRNDGIVDLGLWKQISPMDLIIPLDTHVHRVARDLGITRRKQPDMRTAKEVTEFFAGIYPDDPALGDFALFGYGIH